MLLSENGAVLGWFELEVIEHLKPQALKLVGFVLEQVEIITDGLNYLIVFVGFIFVLDFDLGEYRSLNTLLSLHIFNIFERYKLTKIVVVLLLLANLFLHLFLVLDIGVELVFDKFFLSRVLNKLSFNSLNNFLDSTNI